MVMVVSVMTGVIVGVGLGVDVDTGAGCRHFNPSTSSRVKRPSWLALVASTGPAIRRSAVENPNAVSDGDPGASEKITPLGDGGRNMQIASIASAA